MDVDLIRVLVAVATVGVSLTALTLAGVRGLRREMRGLRQETRHEFQGLRQEMRHEFQGLRREMRQDIRDLRGHLGRIDSHIGELRERMGHVEGLLKGLRDAFVQAVTPN